MQVEAVDLSIMIEKVVQLYLCMHVNEYVCSEESVSWPIEAQVAQKNEGNLRYECRIVEFFFFFFYLFIYS